MQVILAPVYDFFEKLATVPHYGSFRSRHVVNVYFDDGYWVAIEVVPKVYEDKKVIGGWFTASLLYDSTGKFIMQYGGQQSLDDFSKFVFTMPK